MFCVDTHTYYIFVYKKFENMNGKDTLQFQNGDHARGMAWNRMNYVAQNGLWLNLYCFMPFYNYPKTIYDSLLNLWGEYMVFVNYFSVFSNINQ